MHTALLDHLIKLRVDDPWYDEMLEEAKCHVLRWDSFGLLAVHREEDSEEDSEEEPEEESEGDTDEESEEDFNEETEEERNQRRAEKSEFIRRMLYTFSLP